MADSHMTTPGNKRTTQQRGDVRDEQGLHISHPTAKGLWAVMRFTAHAADPRKKRL